MADIDVSLSWTGSGLEFDGGAADGPAIRVDGSGAAGPSPMQALLLSVAGCTAADVIEITGKMRVELEALDVRAAGERAEEPPRRYTHVRLDYRAHGLAEEDEAKVRRAIELSQEKYCSVLHTLAPDIEVSSKMELA